MPTIRYAAAPRAIPGVAVDAALCFGASMLAAVTLASRVKVAHGAQFESQLPLLFTNATIFTVVMAVMYALVGLYRPMRISRVATVSRIALAMGAGGYVTHLAMQAWGDKLYDPQLVPAAILYLCVGLVLARTSVRMMGNVAPLPRVLIVGTGPEAYAIARELALPGEMARNVVGLYPSAPESVEGSLAGLPVFPADASIPELVARHGIQEVLVAVREQRGGGVPMDQLLACRIRGVPVMDFAAFCEKTRHQVPIDSLKGSWLVYGRGFVQGRMRKVVKRVWDIVSSLVLLVVLAPVMVVAMVAIKLNSRGPAFYRQVRVGLGGAEFTCLKFRSMYVDSEKDGVARWAQRNDPRITPVGAFIRKTRIDELPQLLSVLKGEMSLVGPRPERPSFVEQLRREIPFYDIRHSVKPGLTGWAQVRYHYGATLEDARRKHQFDLYYVKNNSLRLDLLVLIETFSVVMFREGQ